MTLQRLRRFWDKVMMVLILFVTFIFVFIVLPDLPPHMVGKVVKYSISFLCAGYILGSGMR